MFANNEIGFATIINYNNNKTIETYCLYILLCTLLFFIFLGGSLGVYYCQPKVKDQHSIDYATRKLKSDTRTKIQHKTEVPYLASLLQFRVNRTLHCHRKNSSIKQHTLKLIQRMNGCKESQLNDTGIYCVSHDRCSDT